MEVDAPSFDFFESNHHDAHLKKNNNNLSAPLPHWDYAHASGFLAHPNLPAAPSQIHYDGTFEHSRPPRGLYSSRVPKNILNTNACSFPNTSTTTQGDKGSSSGREYEVSVSAHGRSYLNSEINNNNNNNNNGDEPDAGSNNARMTEVPVVMRSSRSYTDITVMDVANGMDFQGIPWNTLPDTREDYRTARLQDTADRMRRAGGGGNSGNNNSGNRDGAGGNNNEDREGQAREPYRFFQSTRRVKCYIVHFQLRNLLWATSAHDVVTMEEEHIVHWDCATRRRRNILDIEREGFPNIQVSTIIANDDLVIMGGFYGEVVLKQPCTGKLLARQRISYDDNAITNAFDIFDKQHTLMTSSNDCWIRCFDLNTLQKACEIRLPTAVNHATRQRDGKLVCAVGDDHLVRLIDHTIAGSGPDAVVAQLKGHSDYSFATWWHPDGNLFCTGSQDKTARIWDARHTKMALHTTDAHGSEIRAVRFSNCGKYLALAEEKDFVHIYAGNNFEKCAQQIDPFGEIAGISFSPDSSALVVAVAHVNYSSLIEFTHSHNSSPFRNIW